MKYKIGDRVLIKTWEQMEREYGVEGNKIMCRFSFVQSMKPYCGKVFTINKIEFESYGLDKSFGYREWSFSDDMILGRAREDGMSLNPITSIK